MLYQIIKILAHAGLFVFFRKRIGRCHSLRLPGGPLIIASNHPNSMLDAIIIGIYSKRPVHFTIRSDMFNRPLFRFLLRHMNGIPVYRQSEEKDKMRKNADSFEQCVQVLRNNGVLLIFAEGATELDWKLKPLKSGLAKIVWLALEDDRLRRNLKVLPLGLTYSSYNRLGKTLYLECGPELSPSKFFTADNAGQFKLRFNEALYNSMLPLAPQMEPRTPSEKTLWTLMLANAWQLDRSNAGRGLDMAAWRLGSVNPSDLPEFPAVAYPFLPLDRKKMAGTWTGLLILALPAVAGLVLNAAFYFPITIWSRRKTRGTIFYDSLRFALLVLLYPVYVLLVTLVLSAASPIAWYYWVLGVPLSGAAAAYAGYFFFALLNGLRINRHQKKWLVGMIRGQVT